MRKRHQAEPQQCAVTASASGETEGLQVAVGCRHQRGWFYRDVSLFSAILGDSGQQILYPVTLNVTATNHQSPSSTRSLSSGKKFQLISTQYLFHARYLPDNMQESIRMQNKTDKLPPLGAASNFGMTRSMKCLEKDRRQDIIKCHRMY